MPKSCFWSLLLLVMLTSSVGAQTDQLTAGVKESYSTADFSRVVDKSKELVEKYSKENVLVVVDIDNTLLAMNQDLGSDQWYNWQNGLLENDPSSPDLVAADFKGLLGVQGTLFSLCLLYTSPSPRDLSTSRMPSSA